MRATPLAVLAAAVLVAGCGSGSEPSAAPPPAPDPGAADTVAQPGAQPEPPQQPEQPQPQPPAQPQPPPQQPPQPEPDRFVDVERLDQNAECDALVPTRIPAPVIATAEARAFGGCGRGLSEGTGHVAGIIAFGPSGGAEYQAFGPDGRPEQRFAFTGELWAQPEGWQGVRASRSGVPSTAELLTFFADGSPRRSENPEPSAFSARGSTGAQDPRGGALVVQWGPTGTGDCLGEARRYDATGAPAGAPGRVGCFAFAAGVSTAGEALVLEPLPGGGFGSAVLRWLTPEGAAARPPSEDSFRPTGQLRPLLDGSLVAFEGSSYARRYPRLAAASEAPPAWLAGRSGQSFRFTRGNRGYAFFPAAGQNSPDCTQVVELVAPSGRRCARLTFRRDGNACVTGSIDQGWDGTVVQQASSGACGWRFWPELLGG